MAVFLSFFSFSILHFFELFEDGAVIGMVGIINLLFISILWSILTLKNKNISGACGFHFIWNFALFNIIGLNVSGIESNASLLTFTSKEGILTGGSYGIEASILTAIVLLITILVINKKRNQR